MKSLHRHQAAGLRALLSAGADRTSLCAQICTGAGKTVLAAAFAGKTFRDRFTRVLFISTMRHILGGFKELGGKEVSTPDGVITVPNIMLVNTKELLGYLCSESQKDGAVMCCNALLAREDARAGLAEYAKLKPEFAKRLLVVIDECHHRDAKQIAKVLKILRDAGATDLGLTATPDGNGKAVSVPSDTFSVYRTLSEHMAEGFAPSRILSEIIDAGGPSEDDKHDVLIPLVESAARLMAECWIKDGRPKLCIRIRSTGSSQSNRDAVDKIRRAFVAAGADGDRVLDATGVSLEDQNRFLNTMKEEAKLADKDREGGCSYASSKFDVVIGIHRVVEGMDWPFCSHVYIFGIPRSYRVVKQLMGRAVRYRKHISGYPDAWVTTSKVVLFASGLDGKSGTLSDAHLAQTAFIASTLASYDLLNQRSIFRELANLSQNYPYETTKAVTEPPLDERIRDSVNMYLNKAAMALSAGGALDRPATLSEYVKMTRSMIEADYPDPSSLSEELRAERAELLGSCSKVVGVRYAEANPDAMAHCVSRMREGLDSGKSLRDSLGSAIMDVVNKFKGEAMVVAGDVLQMFRLDSETMESCAARMFRAMPNLSDDELFNGVKRFVKDNGTVPVPGDCVVVGLSGRRYSVRRVDDSVPGNRNDTFDGYHSASKSGRRGLPARAHGLWDVVRAEYERRNPGVDWTVYLPAVHARADRKSGSRDGALTDTVSDDEYRRMTAAKLGCWHYAYFYPAAMVISSHRHGPDVASAIGIDLCLRVGRLGLGKARLASLVARWSSMSPADTVAAAMCLLEGGNDEDPRVRQTRVAVPKCQIPQGEGA